MDSQHAQQDAARLRRLADCCRYYARMSQRPEIQAGLEELAAELEMIAAE